MSDQRDPDLAERAVAAERLGARGGRRLGARGLRVVEGERGEDPSQVRSAVAERHRAVRARQLQPRASV